MVCLLLALLVLLLLRCFRYCFWPSSLLAVLAGVGVGDGDQRAGRERGSGGSEGSGGNGVGASEGAGREGVLPVLPPPFPHVLPRTARTAPSSPHEA